MIDTEKEPQPFHNPHWMHVLHNVRRDIRPVVLFLQDLAITALLQREITFLLRIFS